SRNLQRLFIGRALEAVAQDEARIWGEADAEGLEGFVRESASRKIFARPGAFGTPQLLLEEPAGALVQVYQHTAELGLERFAFAGVRLLRQRDAGLLRH